MTPFTTTLTYEGLPLNLSGKRDAEDCWIEVACVAGTEHNIVEHLAEGVVDRLAELADAQVARECAEQRADNLRTSYEFERFARHL